MVLFSIYMYEIVILYILLATVIYPFNVHVSYKSLYTYYCRLYFNILYIGYTLQSLHALLLY